MTTSNTTIQNPLITVVTVCLNSEKLLEQTMKSVIEQTYDNIEYIIIDGGSTDGTLGIIKKYEEYIDKWISEPDEGIYDAMNKGVDMANGELINFLNSGDTYFDKETIKKIVNFYKEKNSDIVFGDTQIVSPSGEVITHITGKIDPPDHRLIKISHQSAFISTSLHKKNKYDTNHKICADYNLFTSLLLQKYKFNHINQTISKYLDNGYSFSPHKMIEDIKIHQKYFGVNKLFYDLLAFTKYFFRYCRNKLIMKIVGEEKYSNLKKKWIEKKFN